MEFFNLADQQAKIEEVRRVLGSKLALGPEHEKFKTVDGGQKKLFPK